MIHCNIKFSTSPQADTEVLSTESFAGSRSLKPNILLRAPMYALTLETTISIPAPVPLGSENVEVQ